MIENGMTESVTGTSTGVVPVFSAKFPRHTLNITMEIKFKRTKLYKLDIAPVQSNSQVLYT